MVVVLGRRAQQGHAADIDRLDGLRAAGTGGHRLHEGIEIDHHQVDQLQPTFGELLQMPRLVAARQDAGVDIGVQRLHPPIEHFREPCQLLQRVDRHVRLAQGAIRTASMVPANSGSREGWMLMTRPSNSRVKARSRIASYPAQTTSSTPCWRSFRTISQSRALRSGKAARRNTWREMPAFFAISSAGHSRLAHTITTRAG